MINPATSAAQEPVEPDDSAGPRATSQRRELALVVAARLRELRARRNLTQDEVAKAVGCHESAVSRWESGSRLPPCTDILALARLYRVSCDELLGRREQPAMSGSALIDIALHECERFYPAFQYVLWGGRTPTEAIDAAMLETVGEA